MPKTHRNKQEKSVALGPEVSCFEEPGDTSAPSTSVFGFVGRGKVMFASEEGRGTNGPANTAPMSGQRWGWDPGPLFFPFPRLPLTPCTSRITGALPSPGFFNHKACKWVTLSVGYCVSSGNTHRLCDLTVRSHVLTGGPQGVIASLNMFSQTLNGETIVPASWGRTSDGNSKAPILRGASGW